MKDWPASSIQVIHSFISSGAVHGWDRQRYDKLCTVLHCQPIELAAFCCFWDAPPADKFPSPAKFHAAYKDNFFPPVAAIQLARLESGITNHLNRARGSSIIHPDYYPTELLVHAHTEDVPRHD